jgi:hypothetical protein
LEVKDSNSTTNLAIPAKMDWCTLKAPEWPSREARHEVTPLLRQGCDKKKSAAVRSCTDAVSVTKFWMKKN